MGTKQPKISMKMDKKQKLKAIRAMEKRALQKCEKSVARKVEAALRAMQNMNQPSLKKRKLTHLKRQKSNSNLAVKPSSRSKKGKSEKILKVYLRRRSK